VKIIECEQGSSEWLKARCGIPTASMASAIVTPTGKPVTGGTRRRYALELVGERLTGSSAAHYVSAAMVRGSELERLGRAWYQLATGEVVVQVGFITTNDGLCGCSPDGVTNAGGIEIKCPLRPAYMEMLDTGEIDPRYILQMQFCMYVTARPWWDFVLYTDEPGLPNVVWRVKRDARITDALPDIVKSFCDDVAEIEARIRRNASILPPREPWTAPPKLAGDAQAGGAAVLEKLEGGA